MRYLVLSLIFLFSVFSCESSAPVPETVAGAEVLPPGDDLSAAGTSSSETTEGSDENPDQETSFPEVSPPGESGPEASLPEEGERFLPLPELESDEPDTTLPPEIPAEENPELPEPRPPEFSPPRSEPPPLGVTPTPPAAAPRPEPPRESPAEVPAPDSPAAETPASPPPVPQQETPRQEQARPPSPREPPVPPDLPPFVRPAEPEIPPPAKEPVPLPVNPPPELPARPIPETAGEAVVFSRIVRVTVGQIVEIPFRGTGWVYLGELGNRRGVAYDSRRLDIANSAGVTEGQSFIFRAEAAGTYALKFYKQDFIRDYIINDYVQVIVSEAPEYSESGRAGFPVDRGKVIAEPRWPPPGGVQSTPIESALPEAESSPLAEREVNPPASASQAENMPAQETIPAAETPPASAVPQSPPGDGAENETPPAASAAPSTPAEVSGAMQPFSDDGIVPVAPPQAVTPSLPQSPSFSPDDPPAEYARRAKEEFDAGRVESALVILDVMRQRFPAGTDEAWWLYGQLLEANSPSRDIRLALEYYRRLVREYPQSPRAQDALRRIAYLERYYFNIR